MKAEFFKAVCPLEIGDTVAIKATKDGETKEALYLPQGCTVITTAAVALHKVTDIATLHYTKAYECGGACSMQLLRGQPECAGYISRRKRK